MKVNMIIKEEDIEIVITKFKGLNNLELRIKYKIASDNMKSGLSFVFVHNNQQEGHVEDFMFFWNINCYILLFLFIRRYFT